MTDGIRLYDPKLKREIISENEIKKAGSNEKTDIIVEFVLTGERINCSIKSQNGSAYAIMNHTSRNAKIFKKGGKFHDRLPQLDTFVDRYKELRSNDNHPEDIDLTKILEDLDEECKNCLNQLLTYFVFEGTGRGHKSTSGIDAVLLYKNGNLSCEYNKENYINSIFEHCKVSLRSGKGMPKPDKITEFHQPWIYEAQDGKLKGALHVRVKKH